MWVSCCSQGWTDSVVGCNMRVSAITYVWSWILMIYCGSFQRECKDLIAGTPAMLNWLRVAGCNTRAWGEISQGGNAKIILYKKLDKGFLKVLSLNNHKHVKQLKILQILPQQNTALLSYVCQSVSALWRKPHWKWEIKEFAKMTTSPPIFEDMNCFRLNIWKQ